MTLLKSPKRFNIGVISILLVFTFLFIQFSSVHAAGKWRLLGKKAVNGKIDHDSIVITKAKGPLKVLKFHVKGSALELHKIVVTFADSEKFEPKTRLVFEKGAWSRTIDLPGKERLIRQVDFYYSNLPLGGRAFIKLYGK